MSKSGSLNLEFTEHWELWRLAPLFIHRNHECYKSYMFRQYEY